MRALSQKYKWTQTHGDNYRKIFDTLSWEQVRDLTDSVQLHNYQVSSYPVFLLYCLDRIPDKTLRVAELGGFDGYQALTAIEIINKKFTWTNYDICKYVVEATQKNLKKYDYHVELLEKPFYQTKVPEYDLFYSSKTLEHIKLAEVLQTIEHMKNCKYQIHIVDWFKNDDMHVIEPDSHDTIKQKLLELGYTLRHCEQHPETSLFFAEKTT